MLGPAAVVMAGQDYERAAAPHSGWEQFRDRVARQARDIVHRASEYARERIANLRTLAGVLVRDGDRYFVLVGSHAAPVVPGEGVDLARHVLHVVVLRVRPEGDHWVVLRVTSAKQIPLLTPRVAEPGESGAR